MKPAKAQQDVEIFEFMVKHGETDPQRWSYYEEYIKSRRVKRARDAYPESFDEFMVGADQDRCRSAAPWTCGTSFPIVCEANPRTLKRFLDGAIPLDVGA